MNISDQQEQQPLTRRQLRELRETGATPVVTAAMVESAPSSAEPGPEAPASPDTSGQIVVPTPDEDVESDAAAEPALEPGDTGPALTRRELRELGRTSEVATVVSDDDSESDGPAGDSEAGQPGADPADEGAESASETGEPGDAEPTKSLFSFLRRRRESGEDEPEGEPDLERDEAAEHTTPEDDADAGSEANAETASVEPVDEAAEAETEAVGVEPHEDETDTEAEDEIDDREAEDDADAGGEAVADATDQADAEDEAQVGDEAEVESEEAEAEAEVEPAVEADPEVAPTPEDDAPRASDDEDHEPLPDAVDPRFGESVLVQEDAASDVLGSSFEELVAPTSNTGSQHIAPASLIFSQPSGQPSLSGPIDGVGDILVTGSYELPSSIGSRGHAPGTTDGKDIDAVLLDRELEGSSSPLPVAASSAISTLKPAGEVIRQPVPEKGGKLLMGLALTAGGLMIALSVALILAFTNGVF